MSRVEALGFLVGGRIARLATIRPDGRPHIVPITFAVTDEIIVTMIDHKPKKTTRVQRLRNIETNPSVSVLVDEWAEDWDRLRWVRVDGTARIHCEDDMWRRAREALTAKYTQYSDRPPEGAAIAISIDGVTSWASSG
ncbi:MAG TPA: TIGR03668 family PPOX class F420-dependent oxidoreductase [Acidimicrobiia bacterium]